MTERHAGYLITLDRDIREDDAEDGVLVALRMIKGVASVTPVQADPALHIAEERVRGAIRSQLVEAVSAVLDKPTEVRGRR
ncbi:hypothetical protein [Embleya sp. NPDC005971]|uniref:hypothetical protein n=1 Tax=Embleya sp. NPDC005971 TaxID=3156724 RepID=UPI0033FFE252